MWEHPEHLSLFVWMHMHVRMSTYATSVWSLREVQPPDRRVNRRKAPERAPREPWRSRGARTNHHQVTCTSPRRLQKVKACLVQRRVGALDQWTWDTHGRMRKSRLSLVFVRTPWLVLCGALALSCSSIACCWNAFLKKKKKKKKERKKERKKKGTGLVMIERDIAPYQVQICNEHRFRPTGSISGLRLSDLYGVSQLHIMYSGPRPADQPITQPSFQHKLHQHQLSNS